MSQQKRFPPTALIVVGLIEAGDRILLVQQQGPDDPAPYWVAPGGLVEPGEGLGAALCREVAEEAGVEVQTFGPPAYTTQIDHLEGQSRTIAFGFPIRAWIGTPAPRDPDGEILAVHWVSRREAVELLQAITWRGMREPLLAYLRGVAPCGTLWHYREKNDGQELIEHVPA